MQALHPPAGSAPLTLPPSPVPAAAGSPLRVCLPMRQKSMLLARGSKAAATNLAVVGGLSVTRSLGDLKFAPAGVVPTPDVVVLPRGAAPRRQQQPGGGGSGGSWLPEWLQRWQQGEQDELGGGAAADMQGSQDAARSAQQEAAQQAPAEVLVVATDGLWEMVGSQVGPVTVIKQAHSAAQVLEAGRHCWTCL